jgi:uncharacterized protein involved in exopolysaccharide biosynthesis
MLQRVEFEDEGDFEEHDRGHLLRLDFYLELAKRRWLYFAVPFIAVILIGVPVVFFWPAIYLSQGTILVQSQQIPTELVRPTVTSAAQERIQVIEQRTMTRDNLMAIVDKLHLFPQKRDFMSVTELVDEVKKSTKIAPVDPTLDFKQRSRLENPTIVFSVGFEYPDPQIAAQVANELVTRILSEDLRDRTSRANDTTKFLAREAERLQGESTALDDRIARLKASQGKVSTTAPDQSATALAQLRAELVEKSALYSPRHPTIQALTKQIQALEKAISPAPKGEAASVGDLDSLTAQRDALQKDLEVATAKLGAAHLGENLEKEQQSEKLEVIEQPTVPQRPIRPNRGKLLGLSVMAAFGAGFALAFLVEFADKTIRRSSDIFNLVDSRLVVAIPYIVTAAETSSRKRRLLVVVSLVIAVLSIGMVGASLLLPLDLIVARAKVGLFH